MSQQRMLPHTVRIKRKRQDEPVETLHVHYTPQQQLKQDDPKKRRFTLDQPASSHPAEFRRVLQQDPAVGGASASIVAEGATSSLAAAGPTTATTATTTSPGPTTTTASPAPSSISDRKILAPATATRRFHLSTKSAPSPSSSPGGPLQKRKNVATLVESKPKKTRTATAAGAASSSNSPDVEMSDDEPGAKPHQQPPTTLKRPGRTARSASPAVGTNGATPTSTPATATTANNTKDKSAKGGAAPVDPGLLSEMQKFAQEVEHAEGQRERAAPAATTPSKPTPIYPPTMASPTPQKLKFQPKATPRYRDRHPERFSSSAKNNGADGMDIDTKHESDSDSDDGDYVYDTYIRYDGPSSDTITDSNPPSTTTTVPPSPLPTTDIGILIIDIDQQPLWETYLEADPADAAASDKEFDTDDEDENAEDFYANEYPEDEVASDDERDEGAYAYRVAASDEEEWDRDAPEWSDDDEEEGEVDLRRPWGRGVGVGRRPAWLKGGGGGGGGNGSDSE
ncbi:hypothetical protein UCDDS831_g07575 [Diplodia seriata]|uniref:Transcription factor Iwr1 domain-containing protein n=1 Tax=Diplodia seriata TaxID=420778 RepID=A0A0G2DZA7_9PEZI|nr:hypothetical protein UCDDS831_g07575 [Diplodia seriata]